MGTLNIGSRKLYIYGGVSHRTHPNVKQLDLKLKNWQDSEVAEQKVEPQCYRLAHSANLFNKKLFVFGGEVHDQVSKHSYVSNELLYARLT